MIFKNISEAEDYYKGIDEYVDEYNLSLDNNKIISNMIGKIKENKKIIKQKYESYDYKCK